MSAIAPLGEKRQNNQESMMRYLPTWITEKDSLKIYNWIHACDEGIITKPLLLCGRAKKEKEQFINWISLLLPTINLWTRKNREINNSKDRIPVMLGSDEITLKHYGKDYVSNSMPGRSSEVITVIKRSYNVLVELSYIPRDLCDAEVIMFN
jgi:hypothetical protein